MANEIDQGGYLNSHWSVSDILKGITRRDWLAGLAMQGILSNSFMIQNITKLINCQLKPKDSEAFDVDLVCNVNLLALRMADGMIKKSKEK